MRVFLFAILPLLVGFAGRALAWDSQDHEIFDLVSALETAEGKGTTFYSFLNTTKSATSKEISSAYRRRSLELHPDKNPDLPHASDRYAQLGVITAILRDDEKRKKYDYFYDNGVPRWRGSGYYYQRYQPGIGAVSIFLMIIITVVQTVVQYVNYGQEIKRIKRFQMQARQLAWGRGLRKQEGRKKVKVPLKDGPIIVEQESDSGDEGPPEPTGRQKRMHRRATGGPPETNGVNMVVEGDKVWIVGEGGEEIPLDETAAVKPSWTRTWLPALAIKAYRTVNPPPAEEYDDSEIIEDEEEEPIIASTTATAGLPAPAKKIAGGRRKQIKRK